SRRDTRRARRPRPRAVLSRAIVAAATRRRPRGGSAGARARRARRMAQARSQSGRCPAAPAHARANAPQAPAAAPRAAHVGAAPADQPPTMTFVEASISWPMPPQCFVASSLRCDFLLLMNTVLEPACATHVLDPQHDE